MSSCKVRRIDPESPEGKAAVARARGKPTPDPFASAKDALERKQRSGFGLNGQVTEEWNEGPSMNSLGKIREFDKWLSLFFIKMGKYSLTEKAIEEFGKPGDVGKTQGSVERPVEKGEDADRDRPDRTNAQKKALAARTVSGLIDRGFAEQLYDEEYVARPFHLDWKDADTRKEVIRKYVELSGKSPKEINFRDFRDSGLGGLLAVYYKNSPYLAFVEAELAYSPEDIREFALRDEFPGHKCYPWEAGQSPRSFFGERGMRIAAIRWIVQRMGKGARELISDDFETSGLGGLLCERYRSSPYLALAEAGLAYSSDEIRGFSGKNEFPAERSYPWELKMAPSRFYLDKDMRVAAVRWLVQRSKKDARSVTANDFDEYGLDGALDASRRSPYAAIAEAGFAYSLDDIARFGEEGVFPSEKAYPWEMEYAPHIYDNREVRIAAVKWLAQKTGKKPHELRMKEFTDSGLESMLAHYPKGSPVNAIAEAGFITR